MVFNDGHIGGASGGFDINALRAAKKAAEESGESLLQTVFEKVTNSGQGEIDFSKNIKPSDAAKAEKMLSSGSPVPASGVNIGQTLTFARLLKAHPGLKDDVMGAIENQGLNKATTLVLVCSMLPEATAVELVKVPTETLFGRATPGGADLGLQPRIGGNS